MSHYIGLPFIVDQSTGLQQQVHLEFDAVQATLSESARWGLHMSAAFTNEYSICQNCHKLTSLALQEESNQVAVNQSMYDAEDVHCQMHGNFFTETQELPSPIPASQSFFQPNDDKMDFFVDCQEMDSNSEESAPLRIERDEENCYQLTETIRPTICHGLISETTSRQLMNLDSTDAIRQHFNSETLDPDSSMQDRRQVSSYGHHTVVVSDHNTSHASMLPRDRMSDLRKQFPNRQLNPRYWSPEQDASLIALMQPYMQQYEPQHLPWDEIHASFPHDRTLQQIRVRWLETLMPGNKKGKWSETEDFLLCNAFERFGSRWARISEVIEGRTQRQCRTRWMALTKRR